MSSSADKAKRLVQARRAAGYETIADAVRYLGVKYPTYAGHENPNSPGSYQTDAAELYSRKFKVSLDWLLTGRGEMRGQGVVPVEIEVVGLPVLGNIQAGHWLETAFIDVEVEPEMLSVSRDSRFPRARQYALRIVGDSMNLDYPDGSYVTCVDYAESGLRITDGLVVHVERQRAHGQMFEITLKQVVRKGRAFLLVPRSSNPAHQPIHFTGQEDDVIVRGVVTGGWRKTAIPT